MKLSDQVNIIKKVWKLFGQEFQSEFSYDRNSEGFSSADKDYNNFLSLKIGDCGIVQKFFRNCSGISVGKAAAFVNYLSVINYANGGSISLITKLPKVCASKEYRHSSISAGFDFRDF